MIDYILFTSLPLFTAYIVFEKRNAMSCVSHQFFASPNRKVVQFLLPQPNNQSFLRLWWQYTSTFCIQFGVMTFTSFQLLLSSRSQKGLKYSFHILMFRSDEHNGRSPPSTLWQISCQHGTRHCSTLILGCSHYSRSPMFGSARA